MGSVTKASFGLEKPENLSPDPPGSPPLLVQNGGFGRKNPGTITFWAGFLVFGRKSAGRVRFWVKTTQVDFSGLFEKNRGQREFGPRTLGCPQPRGKEGPDSIKTRGLSLLFPIGGGGYFSLFWLSFCTGIFSILTSICMEMT